MNIYYIILQNCIHKLIFFVKSTSRPGLSSLSGFMTRQIPPLSRHMLMLVTCKCVNILICQMWTSGVTLTEHTTPQPRVRSLYELGNRSALYMDTGSSNNKYTVYYRSSQCCFRLSERYFQRTYKRNIFVK